MADATSRTKRGWDNHLAPALIVRLLCALSLQTLNNPALLFSRKEFITPITDSKRVFEALFLNEHGVDPYAGDAFHQPPIMLLLYYPFHHFRLPPLYLHLFWLMLDIVIAFLIRSIAFKVLDREQSENKTESKTSWIPNVAFNVYLLNPFTILTSLATSSIVFNNLALVLSLYHAYSGNVVLSIFAAVFSAHLTIYPITTVLPLSIISGSKLRYTLPLSLFFLASLIGISYSIVDNWNFLSKAYAFVIFVNDLTPNIGLFWYFFMEVFKQFRTFFIFAYQYHAFLYTVPLYLRLKHNPLILFWIYLSIVATFKSYPSYGDVALQVGLLPLVCTQFSTTKYGFISGVVAVFVAALAPLFWQMWIYNGSGNANFYYAINLVFTFTQVLFVTDVASIVVGKQNQKEREEEERKAGKKEITREE
ncbi:hypothetical protein PROFUN_15942 [Planoprotostelium fungivorum]|nr:hypothetical protein PROFUN_15942 [Planoprotostelium fungivorum]